MTTPDPPTLRELEELRDKILEAVIDAPPGALLILWKHLNEEPKTHDREPEPDDG